MMVPILSMNPHDASKATIKLYSCHHAPTLSNERFPVRLLETDQLANVVLSSPHTDCWISRLVSHGFRGGSTPVYPVIPQISYS